MHGYTGNILKADLTAGTFEVLNPGEDFYRKYIGGSCMGVYYLLRDMPAGIDPLSPESVMVFSVGPITGAKISGASRHSVTAKSPLTGGIAASEAGGYWAPELKKAGFDALILVGKAKKPSYLWIHDGKYELRDAAHLWGTPTKEAQSAIREELGDKKIRVAQIGVAGERQCLYANIVNECAHFNGRGGLGAVMGSKNLRAIAVRGTQEPNWFDAEGLSKYGREMVSIIKENEDFQDFIKNGTYGVVDEHIGVSGLPTRNWTSGTFEGQNELESSAWGDLIKPGTCHACALSCKRHVDSKKTSEVDAAYGGPEYETVGMCGSNLGISSRLDICKINAVAAKYAFDTISFGATVSFLIECFEKGYIDENYTGGLKLAYGDGETVIQLAEMTGQVVGFGAKIAQGSEELAREIGQGSKDLLLTVRGKELPAHMPQTKTSIGLMYAFAPVGADHVAGEMDGSISAEPIPERLKMLDCDSVEDPFELNIEKAKFQWRTQLAYSFFDTASVCVMTFGTSGEVGGLEELVRAINKATGWDTSFYELMMVAERRIQMMRVFNIREGLTPEDDALPKKLYTPLTGGVSDGFALKKSEFEAVKRFFYEMVGWTEENGAPSKSKLQALNLGWLVE